MACLLAIARFSVGSNFFPAAFVLAVFAILILDFEFESAPSPPDPLVELLKEEDVE